MSIKVPDSIGEVVEKITATAANKRRADEANRQAALRQERATERAVRALRKRRLAELVAQSNAIMAWCRDLVRNPGMKGAWEIVGEHKRLTLFYAKFWRGLPDPDSNFPSAQLALELRRFSAQAKPTPRLWYSERAHVAGAGVHTFRSIAIETPVELFDLLHPDFIAQLHAHIKSPAVWERIARELESPRPRP